MSRAAISVVALIVTLAIFGAVVVADPSEAEAHDVQPSSGGRAGAERRGQSISAVGTTPSNLGRVGTRDSAVAGTKVNAIETAVGRSGCTGSNGTTGGGATGRPVSGNGTAVGGIAVTAGGNVTAFGGNATATGNAIGGHAIVISNSSDFARLVNNSSGADFWALLRNLLSQFAADGATAGGQAVGGSAVVLAAKGGRAVGGSALVVAGHGGRAVGGSATVLGVVNGTLRVLRHADGQISNVSGRVASGGVVAVP